MHVDTWTTMGYRIEPAGEAPPTCMGFRRIEPENIFSASQPCTQRATVAIVKRDNPGRNYLCDECAKGWR